MNIPMTRVREELMTTLIAIVARVNIGAELTVGAVYKEFIT